MAGMSRPKKSTPVVHPVSSDIPRRLRVATVRLPFESACADPRRHRATDMPERSREAGEDRLGKQRDEDLMMTGERKAAAARALGRALEDVHARAVMLDLVE